jgi:hypothetical protein
MKLPNWHEEPISKKHNRADFDCGDDVLNEYFQKFARQNHVSGGTKTFLAVSDADNRIIGYYSLAPTSVVFEQTPVNARKGLPHHPVPGFRLARLAIDNSLQGNGLGTQLLLAAGMRCIRVAGEVGGVALFIDAKSERAATWYEKRGAERLIGVPEGFPLPMVIPLTTIEAALKAADEI